MAKMRGNITGIEKRDKPVVGVTVTQVEAIVASAVAALPATDPGGGTGTGPAGPAGAPGTPGAPGAAGRDAAALYMLQDTPEPETSFPIPGRDGAPGATGPAGRDAAALFMLQDAYEPDAYMVPGPRGETGAQGVPGAGGSGGSTAGMHMLMDPYEPESTYLGPLAQLPAPFAINSGPMSLKRLTVAHSNSTVTPTLVTDGVTPWSFAVQAGKTYRITVIANYQSVALTTGGNLGLVAVGAVGTIAGDFWGALAQGTVATGLGGTAYTSGGAAGSLIITSAVNPINSGHNIGMDIAWHCTTGGTIEIRFASEVAASAAQLNIGSCLIVEDLTVQSNTGVDSGVYTPTATAVSNVASTATYPTRWLRTGNTVTLGGWVDVRALAAAGTPTIFRLSLPVPTNLSLFHQLGGAAAFVNTGATFFAPVAIYGDVANDQATLNYASPTNALGDGISFQITYPVL